MQSKLTLTIESSVIAKAKLYAKSEQRSLSDIVESYLKLLTADSHVSTANKPSPIVNQLRGAFREPENLDYKKELEKRRDKKYL